MEFVEIVQGLINSAGFPIAMCVLLCWYVKKQQEDTQELLKGFMGTLSEYNNKLDGLTTKINDLFERR